MNSIRNRCLMDFEKVKLQEWQLDFVNRYLVDQKPQSLLVTKVGTGKTLTTMYVHQEMKFYNSQLYNKTIIYARNISL